MEPPERTGKLVEGVNLTTQVYICQDVNNVTNNLSNLSDLSDMDNMSSMSDIPQLDGNDSIFSSDDNDSINTSNHIPVITGFRPPQVTCANRIPARKTIRRDNRGQLSLVLPSLAVYNHRSIWKKIKNFALEFKEMETGVAFHSEIWEKKGKRKHQYKLEELLEIRGIPGSQSNTDYLLLTNKVRSNISLDVSTWSGLPRYTVPKLPSRPRIVIKTFEFALFRIQEFLCVSGFPPVKHPVRTWCRHG